MEKKINVAEEIKAELEALGSPEKALHLSRFFKTGKGEYGEGDQFLGVKVPEQRSIAKKYAYAGMDAIKDLISSPFHEHRLTALFILIQKYQKSKTTTEKENYIRFYLSHTHFINNWDLVDLSCYILLGHWLQDKEHTLLYQLADSSNLWEQRIAIVSCMYFVRQGNFQTCLAIADKLLLHPHDLIHKATGWLLREIGKKDKNTLVDFLHAHYLQMPRTTLRYAIERFPEEERKKWLKR
ncbi:DNA alkylation repair protein [Odoribacter lunatus]|uniref:DNA alkylation repair protein n=1 Tax=Odoribacter lunatus TaxID=2941335 RepID=UPI00203EF734|nr:DNA alkylation repair protein [Odoribacter lunatus]